jgi:hypothetical protein
MKSASVMSLPLSSEFFRFVFLLFYSALTLSSNMLVNVMDRARVALSPPMVGAPSYTQRTFCIHVGNISNLLTIHVHSLLICISPLLSLCFTSSY